MAREIIQVGATANDGQGDPIRTAFIKTNNNFGELYSKIQLVPPVALTGSVGDVAGMTAYDQEYFYYCFANYNGSSVIWRQVPNALQANVVAISATGNVIANGNIAASYFIGDGSQLTNVVAGAGVELINGNTNITTATDGNANITIGGVSNVAVFTTTGVDITGAITGNSVSATGNINSGNIRTTGLITATGTVTGGNIATGGTVSATGNITGGTVNTAGTGTFGNVNTGGVISATGNITTGGNISATGNVTGNYIIGDGGLLSNVTVTSNVSVSQIANGTSILAVDGTGGNILVTIGGVSNVAQFVSYGLEVAGNVNSANIYLTGRFVSVGNVTGANLLATNNVVATGNVRGTHVNSDLTMSAVGNIQAGNVRTAGTVSATGNVVGNYFIGNGSQLTDVTSSYGNANVVANLAALSSNPVSTTGNVTAGYFVGNGSALGSLTFGNITTFNTAGLTTDELYLQGTTRLNVTASGSSGYIFDQYGTSTLNPVLYISSGQTLAFNLNVSGHPFLIRDSAGANYSTGLSHVATTGTVLADSAAQGQVAGTLYWKVPYGITGNYKYQCSIHGGMVANIVVTDANVSNIAVGSAVTATTAGTVTTAAQANITSVGTLTSLNVTGNTATGNLTTAGQVSAVGNVTGNYFVGTATSAQYADIAENYTSDNNYEPGTVLEFGGSAEVTLATDETPRVAGVVSTLPAHLMNSMLTGEHTVAVALLGRVPCKVQGPIAKGDMLISAGSGYARAKQNPIMGTVIGKALEAWPGNHGVIEVVVGRL